MGHFKFLKLTFTSSKISFKGNGSVKETVKKTMETHAQGYIVGFIKTNILDLLHVALDEKASKLMEYLCY